MKISQYIEQHLLDRPKKENKEWLAKELGVNYKTLCGWFKRNSFDGLILIKMLNILEIDFKDFTDNVVPLSKDEILKIYKESREEKQYILEGMFVGEKEIYSLATDEITEGDLISFNNHLDIELSRNDVFRLLKGYEVIKYIDNKEFIFYVKDSGISVVQKVLEQYDTVRRGILSTVVDITKANVDELFYLLESGDYSYVGRINRFEEPILVDDGEEYDERIILISESKL